MPRHLLRLGVVAIGARPVALLVLSFVFAMWDEWRDTDRYAAVPGTAP